MTMWPTKRIPNTALIRNGDDVDTRLRVRRKDTRRPVIQGRPANKPKKVRNA